MRWDFGDGGGTGRSHYVVTRRHDEEVPDLLRVDVGSGEKALPVFFSGWSAHNFVFSNNLEREWRVGERSPGELQSLLVTLLAHIDWVLLDPPVRLPAGGASATLTHRGNFLAYLGGVPGDPNPTGGNPGGDPASGSRQARGSRERRRSMT